MKEAVERIGVLSVFENGEVRPLKFKWAGRVHTIKKILYKWVTREGAYPVYHFSVLTGTDDDYQLHLDSLRMTWTISGGLDTGMTDGQ